MKRGDVVLFGFPFSDRTGGKLRPAMVVQTDPLNQSIDDTRSRGLGAAGRQNC